MKYQVREGCTHGQARQYKAGDVLELTKDEFEAFSDKFTPFDGTVKNAPSPVVVEKESEEVTELMKKTSKELKDICDGLELEYITSASKIVLARLIAEATKE